MELKETLVINRPATATDAYSGGVQVIRDATNASGGTHGHVNSALYQYTIAGKDIKQFEWNALFKLDNYADAGENCGFYAQANKHGKGPTWGGCIEATDTTPGDDTGLVGLEVDCGVSGTDNGLRYGIDVVLFDGRIARGMQPSDVCEATAGIRIDAREEPQHPKWTEGLRFEGGMDRCIDTTRASSKVAIKLAKGQVIQIGDTIIGESGSKVQDKQSWLIPAAVIIGLLIGLAKYSNFI